MIAELGIWIAGNVLIPVIPVVAAYFARMIGDGSPTLESVLGDGVLYFYAITVAAILMMDLWRDRIGEWPKVSAGISTGCVIGALLFLIFASGAYFVTALAHTGRLDRDSKPFDKKILAQWSWISALVMITLSLAVRIWSGLY